MSIRHWPEEERPREKLLALGARALSDAELISLLLGTGVPGISAVELANGLLRRFSGLRMLLEADRDVLCACPGVGVARYARLAASQELFERYLMASLVRGQAITDAAATKRFLKGRMRREGREIFACLLLDNQHRLIRFEELFFGTIDGASVHAREVVKVALRHNAAAVIFAHNHPSGIAEPSQADRRITERLVAALQLLDIRVLDHLIVGDEEVLSFAERGYL